MSERPKQLSPNDMKVIFCTSEGKMVWLVVDESTQLEELIQEREDLGESVMAITNFSEAKKLIENQQRQTPCGSTNDFQLKRF